MAIIVRAPNDEFTFRLFHQLTSKITASKNQFYIWSAVFFPDYHLKTTNTLIGRDHESELDYRIMMLRNIKQNLIVLGIKDHLSENIFNPWKKDKPIVAEYLSDLFSYYPEKKFILMTSMENLSCYISNENVYIVPWGGDITNQESDYKNLDPVLEKNFYSNKTFLSLNRNNRPHRILLASLLHGLQIEKEGMISCLFKDEIQDVIKDTSWKFDHQHDEIKNKIIKGFISLKRNQTLINDDKNIYPEKANDNVFNFKNKLSSYYKETFVELITETSYLEKSYLITEKTLNSFYGCCFPILFCSQGSVNFLRSIGFDMFDDVVDHSYDSLSDPIERLYQAVNMNLQILTDNNRTKRLWVDRKNRFIKNIEVAKKTLYNFYRERANEIFDTIIKDNK